LAFVPSGLLVAVTAHISTDVAAAPLIWVIPLALYLLTFVIAFRPESRTPCSLEWLLLAIVAILPLAMVRLVGLPVVLSLNLLAYVLAAYICHQRLYALRPAADRLTEFYLFVSLGGVAGGVFSGLIAPHIFVTVLEYPLLLAAALYCLPGVWRSSNLRRMMAPLAAVVLMALLIRVLAWVLPHVVSAWLATFYLGVAFLCFAIIQRNRSALVLFVSVWIIATNVLIFYTPGTTAWRSFFGVHYVVAENGFHKLVHGNTVHGVMRVTGPTGERLTGRPEPLAYYSYDGAFVAAIEAARGMQASPLSVAVIGLGSGTLACHAKDSERWRFFEIDQRVIDTARDRRYFRFLEDCLPDVPVVLGDARLTVAKDPQRYDLIIVDAFLSDSIPLHLVTVEAVREYQTRLLPGGDLVFHISNRNLELEHVLARVAADAGLQAMVREDPPRADGFETKVLVMTEPDGPAVAPLEQRGYKVVTPDMSRSPWTDDYASILEAIRDKWAEGNKAR
jgi:hypothetical protein